jgi:hypothetical protein
MNGDVSSLELRQQFEDDARALRADAERVKAALADAQRQLAELTERYDVDVHELREQCQRCEMSRLELQQRFDSDAFALRQELELLRMSEAAAQTSASDAVEEIRRRDVLLGDITAQLQTLQNEAGKNAEELSSLRRHRRQSSLHSLRVDLGDVIDGEPAPATPTRDGTSGHGRRLSEMDGSISPFMAHLSFMKADKLFTRTASGRLLPLNVVDGGSMICSTCVLMQSYVCVCRVCCVCCPCCARSLFFVCTGVGGKS